MQTLVSAEPVVTTRAGQVRGLCIDGVHVFRGIPFAAPPFGAGRLRPPHRADPWSGVRDAFEFGAEPPQPKPDAETARFVWDPAMPGEDCLNLNVWTPDPAAADLPVMVWIPGGMFEVCSNASCDGSRFARDGVVCVSINYRVGAEGFGLPEGGCANLGLLDQVAALAWVRDNIAAFGGDPGNVTICGESAGAMSVGTLLAVPRAGGLFERAICQSGAAHTVMPAATAHRVALSLARSLGIPPTREAFATVPWQRLVAAQLELKAALVADPDPARWGMEVVASYLPWQPVIDGDVLADPPLARIAAGNGAGVDLMVGSNTEDWRLFTIFNGLLGITEEQLTGPVAGNGFRSMRTFGLDPARALPAYRALYPGASPGDLLASVQTDWYCRIPGIRLADVHAPRPAPTYMYEFAWHPSGPFEAFGACHAMEIGFVFDTLDQGPDQMLGPMLAGAPQQLADTMHRAWVEFARTGDPGWPRYDLAHRATMRFDVESKVVNDPRAAERAIWEGVR